jgi:hypothetical protein
VVDWIVARNHHEGVVGGHYLVALAVALDSFKAGEEESFHEVPHLEVFE